MDTGLLSKSFDSLDKLQSTVGSGWTMAMKIPNMIIGGANMFIGKGLENVTAVSAVFGFINLALSILMLTFVYMTVPSFPDGTDATLVDDNYFAVSITVAHGLFMIGGFVTFLYSLTELAVYWGATDLGVFGQKYVTYTSSVKHGITSLSLISLLIMWSSKGQHGEIKYETLTADDEILSLDAWYWILAISTLVSRYFSELEHGALSRSDSRPAPLDDDTNRLKYGLAADYSFKFSRGPAILASTGLLLYRWYVTTDPVDTWTTWLLISYIAIVVLERAAASDSEELVVFGGDSGTAGLVLTGVLTTALLWSTGEQLGEQRTQSSVFQAIGAILLDAMRVGYGTPEPAKGTDSPTTYSLFRLSQIAIGIFSFMYVIKTSSDEHAATTPVLFGVALAAAATKLTSIAEYFISPVFTCANDIPLLVPDHERIRS